MFYIFHGDDRYMQQETLAELKRKLGDPEMLSLNTTVLDGAGLNPRRILDACNAMPFLAPKRLVIINDYFSSKPPADELAVLVDYLPTMPDSARLVFLESSALGDKHAALKLAEKEKLIMKELL